MTDVIRLTGVAVRDGVGIRVPITISKSTIQDVEPSPIMWEGIPLTFVHQHDGGYDIGSCLVVESPEEIRERL